MNRSNKEIYYTLLDVRDSHLVRDPVWKSITIDKSLTPILKSSAMKRLRRITQLGPISLLYPGATHTRFDHSIGVYHISRQILLHILSDPHCPEISLTQAKSFLAAALLHDVGHFPYTHSLKELPLPTHEALGAQIILKELSTLLEENGISAPLCAAIISQNTIDLEAKDLQVLTLFSQLLSSAMDPDKLDYLCRDAFFGGVPYGFQDIDFAIQQIYLDSDCNIHYHSMLPLEHILFSKYLMYSSMYWHRKVRSATAMVKYSLYRALKEGLLAKKDLIMRDDEEFHRLCYEIQSPIMIPAQKVQRGEIFEIMYEEAYDKKFEILTDLDARSRLEHSLSHQWNIEFVIIDIPEHISFEIPKDGLHTSVFTQHTVHSFVENIRKLRIFASTQDKNIHISKEELEHHVYTLS